jgi:hypothetical protein
VEVADIFDLRTPADRVHQVHATAAGQQENVPDPGVDNALSHIIG